MPLDARARSRYPAGDHVLRARRVPHDRRQHVVGVRSSRRRANSMLRPRSRGARGRTPPFSSARWGPAGFTCPTADLDVAGGWHLARVDERAGIGVSRDVQFLGRTPGSTNPTGWSSCSDSPMSAAHHCLRRRGRRAFRPKWRTRSRSTALPGATDRACASARRVIRAPNPWRCRGRAWSSRSTSSLRCSPAESPSSDLHPPRAVTARCRGSRSTASGSDTIGTMSRTPVTKVKTMPATSGIHHVTRPLRETAPREVRRQHPADREDERGGDPPRLDRPPDLASSPSTPIRLSTVVDVRGVVDHAGDAGARRSRARRPSSAIVTTRSAKRPRGVDPAAAPRARQACVASDGESAGTAPCSASGSCPVSSAASRSGCLMRARCSSGVAYSPYCGARALGAGVAHAPVRPPRARSSRRPVGVLAQLLREREHQVLLAPSCTSSTSR